MEIRSFWRVFRTTVIAFDFRTNYGKSVLVGSSEYLTFSDISLICTTIGLKLIVSYYNLSIKGQKSLLL